MRPPERGFSQRRSLAPRIAVVVSACLALALSLKVEMNWRADELRREDEALFLARSVAERVVAAWDRSGGDVVEIEEALDAAAELAGPLETAALVDRAGIVVWSRSEGLVGAPYPSPPSRIEQGSAHGWVTCARLHGAWAQVRERGGECVAIAPLGTPGRGAVGPRAPRPDALVLSWNTSAVAAARAVRHFGYHASGLLFSVAVGLALWLVLRIVLTRPLGALAAAAGRSDRIASDFDALAGRRDEIGVLARAMGAAQAEIEAAHAATAAREARLAGAIQASADGLVLASRHGDRWLVDHVNETFARLCHRAVNALEGRPLEEVLDPFLARTGNPPASRSWVESALADADFEDARTGMLHVEGEATEDGHEDALALEVTTRPVRDAAGEPIGRLWVVRDVTRERTRERRLRRQNQELAALDLVGRRVSRSLDRAAVLTGALETLREVFDAPFAWAGDPLAAGGEPVARLLAPHVAALRAGGVVSLADTLDDPAGAMLAPRARSVVALPLRDAGGLVAVLALGRPAPRAFGDDEISLLRRLVPPIDAALQNARLFARTEEQLVENRTLTEVSRSIGRAEELDAVLEEILRVVHQRLHYRNAAILLPDEGGKVLYVRASVGYHTNLGAIRLPVDGDSVTARTLRSGEAINVADVADEPGYIAGSDDIRSELALPLQVGDRVLGVLDVESDRVAAFGPDDERLLASVAQQAAMVLQNAGLLAETRDRAARFAAVNEIARAVSSTLDPVGLDRAIVSQLARVVPCARYAVLHYDHEARVVRRTVTLDVASGLAHDGDGASWAFEDAIDPETLSAHLAFVLPDLGDDRCAAEARLVAQGMKSLVLVPIALDGVVSAAIVAVAAPAHGFDAGQVRLLEAVSWHVGVALKNAQLFTRLQQSYTQLDEAQDGLVRSEKLRALGEMASGVAHDFNNVLGAILGRAQLLRLAVEDADAKAELEIIEKAAQDGAATVRRLQDFTRVRTDRGFRPVDLRQVVEDSLSLTRGRWRDEAGRAGLAYDVTHSAVEVPAVAGEASELREVLTNLILNAIDAMPGGGTLRLATGRTPTGEVRVTVADSGEGMSDEVRARIFDPFFTTKGVRGVGLGLSVVYGIVQRHGGRIEVRSAPGRGTTMELVLPAIEGAAGVGAAMAGAAAVAGAAVPPAFATGPALRVLLADDEPGVRSLLTDLLAVAGHAAEAFPSGRELLAALDAVAADPSAVPVDLVLTDLGMPDMSGWDVARAVRERPGGPPVVLVTGWGIQLDDQILAESAVTAVIAKPFTLEDVLTVVRRAASRREAA